MSATQKIIDEYHLATESLGTFGTIFVAVLALAFIAAVLVFGAALNIWVLNTLFSLALPYVWQTLLASFVVNLKFSYMGSASIGKVVEAIQGKK